MKRKSLSPEEQADAREYAAKLLDGRETSADPWATTMALALVGGERTMSPWVPMTAAKDKKVIGKLLEELGEAVAIAARCLIQGINEPDPGTGKNNRLALAEELADVDALTTVAIVHFGLDKAMMSKRADRKMREKVEWLEMDGGGEWLTRRLNT